MHARYTFIISSTDDAEVLDNPEAPDLAPVQDAEQVLQQNVRGGRVRRGRGNAPRRGVRGRPPGRRDGAPRNRRTRAELARAQLQQQAGEDAVVEVPAPRQLRRRRQQPVVEEVAPVAGNAGKNTSQFKTKKIPLSREKENTPKQMWRFQ